MTEESRRLGLNRIGQPGRRNSSTGGKFKLIDQEGELGPPQLGVPGMRRNDIILERKYSFEIPPSPVSPDTIRRTFTSDIVVVGGGMSGMSAALRAVEMGAGVILIEKTGTFQSRGGDNAYIGTRIQKKLGIEIDKNEVIQNLMKHCANKPDRRLLRLLIDKGAEVSDWLFDMTDVAGIKFNITNYPPPSSFNNADEWYPQYLVTHAVEGGEPLVVECIMNNAKKKGVIMHFDTRAKQLIRKDKDRVTGVIAQNSKGDYVQYNAAKGVILCTGDFGYNDEMMAKYAPQIQYLASKLKTSTGDGHQMAMWIGAQMEKGPGAPITHGFPGPLGTDAFLQVNRLGERFHNEDVTGQAYTNQIEKQPGQDAWQVFDSKYPEQLPFMGIGHGKVNTYNKGVKNYVEDSCKKAGTIEDLAKLMEVPVDAFAETIKRYNEMAHAGKDLDFGKRTDRLFPVENPPYYACKGTYELLVVFCGLNVNTDLQPLDAEWKVIPGLYVAGNVVGNRFAVDYPLMCPGLTHAMATTSGYIVGQNAATL